MKWLFFCFLVLSFQISFAQSSAIEKRYKEEKQRFVEIETKLNKLEQSILASGEIPKDNFEYVGLEGQYKLQKKNFKIAEKAWKTQQKENLKLQKLEEKRKAEQLKQEQIGAIKKQQASTEKTSSDLATMTDKEKIKVLKKDIKRLQAYKKQLIQEAVETQTDPTQNPKIQETNNYIVKKQAELISLGQSVKLEKTQQNQKSNSKKKEKKENSSTKNNHSQTNNHSTSWKNNEIDETLPNQIKQKKKVIRSLKKKSKELDFQLYNDPNNEQLRNEKVKIETELNQQSKIINQLKAKLSAEQQSLKQIEKQEKESQKQIEVIQNKLPEHAKLVIDTQKIEELKKQLKQLKIEKKELTNALRQNPESQKINDNLATNLRLIDAVKQQISIEKNGKIIEHSATNQSVQEKKTISINNQNIENAPLETLNENTTQRETTEIEQGTEVEETLSIPEIGLTTILFDKFSTEIKNDYQLYINYVAKQLIDHPHLILSIDAYTDNSEKERIAKELTTNMAKSVAREFLKRGISAERLNIKAKGSKQPVGDNKTYFGQIRNRRVELSFQTK